MLLQILSPEAVEIDSLKAVYTYFKLCFVYVELSRQFLPSPLLPMDVSSYGCYVGSDAQDVLYSGSVTIFQQFWSSNRLMCPTQSYNL